MFVTALTTFPDRAQPVLERRIQRRDQLVRIGQSDSMNSVRQVLWKSLIVGMIPFILGAGLPQRECRCAAAKGQRWSECCFRTREETPAGNSLVKPCCRRHWATDRKESSASHDCPTCPQFRNPKSGSCCQLTLTKAPTLCQRVNVSDSERTNCWLPLIAIDRQVTALPRTACEDISSHADVGRPLDRVIVFERLMI